MMDVMARADGPKGPAEEAVDQLLNQGFLDELMDRVDEGGVQLTGEGGFLPELVKRVLEAGLQAELTCHLGYEKHDPAGSGSGNSRNGSTPKRLGTEVGDLDLAAPRDRNGTFDPRLVPKGQRRVGGLGHRRRRQPHHHQHDGADAHPGQAGQPSPADPACSAGPPPRRPRPVGRRAPAPRAQ